MLRKAAVPKRICDRRRAQNAFELFIYFIRHVMTDMIPDNKILNLSYTSGSVLRKFRILYVF